MFTVDENFGEKTDHFGVSYFNFSDVDGGLTIAEREIYGNHKFSKADYLYT